MKCCFAESSHLSKPSVMLFCLLLLLHMPDFLRYSLEGTRSLLLLSSRHSSSKGLAAGAVGGGGSNGGWML